MTHSLKKVMHFLGGEKQAGRCVDWTVESVEENFRRVSVATLFYRNVQMGYDATACLHGMSCRVLRQDIDDKMNFVIKVELPKESHVRLQLCEACHGSGTFKKETCWHCDGEGTDPTL